ncbi:MAG: cytochrome c oxidase subunit II [Thalassobaculaceae bacterium]
MRTKKPHWLLMALAGLITWLGMAAPTMAAQPEPWQMNYQDMVTPVGALVDDFHNLLLVVEFGIAIFVFVLLAYTCVRFRRSANPNPSKTTHNTFIEVIWTAVPVLILVVIAVPSFKLLYYMDKTAEPDLTVKVTANQWYWDYEYPDQNGLVFSSNMLDEEEAKEAGDPRLLGVDNPLVVPVGKNIQVLVTSNDVMHSFFVPSLAVQIYGIAGRSNETWMRIDKAGTYYGQCNQICGVNHSFMPIKVIAVEQAEYDQWLVKAKEEFALNSASPKLKLAAVTTDRASQTN